MYKVAAFCDTDEMSNWLNELEHLGYTLHTVSTGESGIVCVMHAPTPNILKCGQQVQYNPSYKEDRFKRYFNAFGTIERINLTYPSPYYVQFLLKSGNMEHEWASADEFEVIP